MSRLVAHFSVELPGYCLVATPRVRQTPLTCTISGFEVDVQVDAHNLRSIGKKAHDPHWTSALEKLRVKVARDESETPPPVIPNAEGELDYTVQTPYFHQRIGPHGAAACEAVNRVIRFFKFELKTPFLHELPADHQAFRNAEWRDASDTLVGKGMSIVVVEATPGFHGELGVQKLRNESVDSLQGALTNPREPMLHEQLLSDAQTALLERNLKRAVLELAIAAELVVEGTFVSGESPAAKAFLYLEEKARYRVRVLDYLHDAAKKIFGKSFRQDHRNDYDNIDCLFQCRNKIAHTGQLSYQGQPAVTYEVVAHWWDSVILLIDWLGQLR